MNPQYSEGRADLGISGVSVPAALTPESFDEMFPSDAACLTYLKERSYPDGTTCPGCARASKFHAIRGRSAYSCQYCGTHVYPTAGTIFHKTRTGLRLWFWAIYLIASTRGQITVRQLERELGVTYKTAQRMLEHVRDRLGLVGAPPPDRETPPPSPPPAWHGARRRG